MSDSKQLTTKTGFCLGSPRFSPDGRRIVFYEISTGNTWGFHRPESLSAVTGQLVLVEFETGQDLVESLSIPQALGSR